MEVERLIDVSGGQGGSSFLLLGGKKTALFDSGMAYAFPALIGNLERELQGRPLDYVFCGHTHYDHIGALPYLRMRWPELTAVGSEYGQYVLTRPGALKTIWEFSLAACETFHAPIIERYDDSLMKIDLCLKDRQVLDLDGHTVQAIELLGHTKCSMGYLIDGNTLFGSESCAYLGEDGVFTATYLTSSIDTLRSITICEMLRPEYVVSPHYKVLSMKEIPDYWEKCRQVTKDSQQFILSRFFRQVPENQLIREFQERYWVGSAQRQQPLFAFQTNAKVMIQSVIREAEIITKEER